MKIGVIITWCNWVLIGVVVHGASNGHYWREPWKMSKSGPRDHAVASWETFFCSRNVDFPLPCQIWCFGRPMVPCCYGPPWATPWAWRTIITIVPTAIQRPVSTPILKPLHQFKIANYTNPWKHYTNSSNDATPTQNYTNLLLHQSLLIGVARKMNWCNVRTGRITPIYYFFALV